MKKLAIASALFICLQSQLRMLTNLKQAAYTYDNTPDIDNAFSFFAVDGTYYFKPSQSSQFTLNEAVFKSKLLISMPTNK